ncbi:MAG: serine hydrolase domain-containing protein, partial [Pikeienuella sp.]
MKYLVTLSIALWGSAARALPIDAVSYLQARHSYAILGGGAPDSLSLRTFGPNPVRTRDSGIDDAAATLAVDDVATQIGCVGCEPDAPFAETARHRTNRVDPTEFANARYDISQLASQDAGSSFLAFGSETVERSGLAQTRITSDPVGSFARSGYSDGRRTEIVNEADEEETLVISGAFEFSLLASYNGEDGLARTSAAIDLLFDGVGAEDVSFAVLEAYTPDIEAAAPGATVTESLILNEPGTTGFRFTGSTTAIGDGGFTEATLDVGFRYLLFVTLGAGETAFMDFGFAQANYVEYTPTVAAVPLPAGLPLFGGALALLGLAARRRGAKAAAMLAAATLAPGAALASDLPVAGPSFVKTEPRANFDTDAFAAGIVEALGARFMGYAVTLRDESGAIVARVNHGYARTPCETGGEKRFNGRTVSPIGSVSKALTAATVIHRAENLDGVSLDDPFQGYLPERWRDELHASLRPVTLRHLLQHRGGFAKSAKTLWGHEFTMRERYALGEESYLVRAQNIAKDESACVPAPMTRRCYANTSFALWNLSAASLAPVKWANVESGYRGADLRYDS